MIDPAAPAATEPAGDLTTLDGETVYRIGAVHRLPPFLMNIPSDTDLWMFVTSRGGLTAGRGSPDGAIFPYETVDRLHDSHRHSGPVTLLRARRSGDAGSAWEPLSDRSVEDPLVERNLYKTTVGNALTFEEVHHGLDLSFRARWSGADSLGHVRTATLRNDGATPVEIELLDGLRNVLPHGAPLALYQQSSSLVDAYKRTDRCGETRLAVFSLTSRIGDRAEAAESLRANTVWCAGLPGFEIALEGEALDAFRLGTLPSGCPDVLTGARGNYLMAGNLRLGPGESVRWDLVVDAGRSHVDVTGIRKRIRDAEGSAAELQAAIDVGLASATANLRGLVAAADGVQVAGEPVTCAHHFANVLYNCLRGGVFADDHRVPADDFRAFVGTRHRPAVPRADALLAALAEQPTGPALVRAARESGDADLERLALEYLPLHFGRRHGDPSRPWNRFRIRVRDGHGNPALHYEGNWRDIFQNWEALAWSFPGFLPNLVAKFVNASTVDGFNPYRITRDGVDWETEDPDDPWSYIGYWGDHQVIYLLKLLEALDRFAPGTLREMLDRRIFAYADVPYRIAPYRRILRDPHATIRFDTDLAERIAERVERIGTDGKLLPGPSGPVLHVTLLEKLLVPALSKLSNLVPGGGIWMNTQRPEWNDANNALAGNGLSAVTMYYLRRYLAFLESRIVGEDGTARLSARVAEWFRALRDAVASFPAAPADDDARRRWMDAAGEAFSSYREAVYASGPGDPESIDRAELGAFCRTVRELLDREIDAQRREDGLYHSYNLLSTARGTASVRTMYEMLEGQVAALSSGAIGAEEACRVVERMFAGPLYRKDQRSFLLYPERRLPSFLERNVVPAARAARVPLLRELLDAEDPRIVVRDADGTVRFQADFANARDLAEALDRLAGEDRWRDAVAGGRDDVLAAFEEVFRHGSFTGRSGAMYGYEGLGCIYWHMVAKLLLAVQEIVLRAEREGEPEAVRAALVDAYYRIRSGLGFEKTVAEYGAFPTDPYSHTPPRGGARQPGMTGQVKEEILTRLGELGVRVNAGAVSFRPVLLRRSEFLRSPGILRFGEREDPSGSVEVPANALAFTLCRVPVVYRLGDAARVRVIRRDGRVLDREGDTLPPDEALPLLGRSGEITAIHVGIPTTRVLG